MSLIAWDTSPSTANSYVTQAQATTYFADAIHASAWTAASTGTKDSALVTATRMLARSQWMGTIAVSGQALQWPREGAIDRYGDAIANTVVPVPIREATYELALVLIQEQGYQDGSPRVSSISTGAGTSVTFASASGSKTRLPRIVQELVFYLLAGFAAGWEGASFGTDPDDNPSDFSDPTLSDRTEPFG